LDFVINLLFSRNEDYDPVIGRGRFISIISKDLYVGKARLPQHPHEFILAIFLITLGMNFLLE